VHLTINQAKRFRPAVTPRPRAFVMLTVDGSIWLDMPGSFG
jgi:hypothetical protein